MIEFKFKYLKKLKKKKKREKFDIEIGEKNF
jgi:hypothetical protein